MDKKIVFLRLKLIIIILLVTAANFGADRLTKNYAVEHLKGQPTVRVAGNFFVMHYAENTGAFLGLGGNLPQTLKTVILILVPLLVVAGTLIYLFLSSGLPRSQLICLASIIGGGLGNLYDRIFNAGVVIDFLNFGIGSIRTGILNVADLSVTFGALVFIILQFLQQRESAAGDELSE